MGKRGPSSRGTARRAEILESAWTYLAQSGYNGASLREISRSMSLDAAHVLYYFGSRERLLTAVLEKWDSDCWRLAEESADHDDRIEVFFNAVARNAEIPGIVQLYLALAVEASSPDHPAHDYLQARFERVRAELRDAIEQRIAEGLLSHDIDADSVALRLIALADGLQLQALVAPGVDPARQLRIALDEVAASGARASFFA